MNVSDDASQALARHANKVLKLTTAVLGDEFRYQSLPQCVLDAVYSIAIRYGAVQALVRRYCQKYGTVQFRPSDAFPAVADQEPISTFIARVTSVGTAKFASDIVQNECLTSPRGGILKSEACKRFAEMLKAHRVEYFQDFVTVSDSPELEAAIKQIPGQRSGISLNYFKMLAGSDYHIKPDRMVLRFVEDAIGKAPSLQEAQDVMSGAVTLLKPQHPTLTLRLLDNTIWKYQREQGVSCSGE